MGNRRGSLLVFCYLLLAFLTTWGATMFRRSAQELAGSERYVDSLQAFHLAEAGLDRAMQWLRSQPTPPGGNIAFDPFTNPAIQNCSMADPSQPARAAQAMAGGTYLVCVDPDDNNPIGFMDRYTISVLGIAPGGMARRQLTKLTQTLSFSRYSYYTQWEQMANGTNIWFTSANHLAGPVHTNDQFNIAGSPVFDGEVTSAAATINYRNPPPTGGNNPQFNAGLSLGVAAITMPVSAAKLRTAAASADGTWYVGNTTIVLQNNGTMLVTNPVAGLTNAVTSLPSNGALFVNGGNLTVSGQLNGQVTLGTSEDVLLVNHVMYANDPEADPNSDDMLGLVAEKNVVISTAAPNDLHIRGSIMALTTSFTVENWWTGSPRGTLDIFGGIIQDRRGPVGTFNSSSGNLLSGYAKDYRYDTRLLNMTPPFFPTTGQFEELYWEERQ